MFRSYFKTILLSLCLLIFFSTSLARCGIGSREEQVDRTARALALTIRTFISFWEEDLGNCADFIRIYDELTEEVQSCDNDGTFQVTKISVSCVDGPPLDGVVTLTLNQNNCQDNGTDITSTGDINMELNFSSAGNIGILATTDLLSQGITFIFDNFQTQVDLSNNNLSCSDSGNLNADGRNCNVSSDCRRCNF